MHDYRGCKKLDCEECQDLVDNGIVMACDDCDDPGNTSADGWFRTECGRTVCVHCFESYSENLAK